ncbi:cupin [Pseudomonas sp. JR33AA]|uniref:cupin n=1 Tax=Pseudomonas sp. JR33AA TaxID=2899113 RepID=UPI001F41435C|nr:cupin [Pseudomonas sp. JR33AA]MCE5977603.1 cupin [Pseudomonas sp. JR33AA]
MTLLNTAVASVQALYFEDDGATPNSRFPVLFYRLTLDASGHTASAFEALFAAHQWTPLWRDGIFDYHHFHPNAHEALGIACGWARLMLGGECGQSVSVKRGDVLVLPAGTGHRCIECSDDFLVVGAYPQGQEDYAIQRPDSATHARAMARIAKVPLPEQDPVSGIRGALMTYWR